jgi:hypothetical protein
MNFLIQDTITVPLLDLTEYGRTLRKGLSPHTPLPKILSLLKLIFNAKKGHPSITRQIAFSYFCKKIGIYMVETSRRLANPPIAKLIRRFYTITPAGLYHFASYSESTQLISSSRPFKSSTISPNPI